jgi:hypothetical protein
LTLTDDDILPALQSVFDLDKADEQTLLAHMRRERGDRPWLFLLDEADRFVRAQSSRDFSTMHHMRALAEEGIAFFILAGFWVLYESAAADYHSPIKNFGEMLEIGPLEPEAAHSLVTIPMAGLGVRYESDALVDRLIEQSGGRANLISITCNELLKSLGTGGRTIDEQALKHALDSQSIRFALTGWERMTDDERLNRLDRILVYATIEDESFGMEELLVRLKPLELSYSSEEIRQSLTRLELAFIFQRKEGRYQFRVPLFRKMVLQQAPDELLQREVGGASN